MYAAFHEILVGMYRSDGEPTGKEEGDMKWKLDSCMGV